jgi:antagonist of KipI
MGLHVIRPGTFSTVQDLGRTGYRAWGVPVGGAFDPDSATLANALVGNAPERAVIEMTLTGGVYAASEPLALALAGAPMAAAVRSDAEVRGVELPGSFTLRPGERLEIGGARHGARTYLAVRGGWQTEPVLGSRSQETRLTAGQSVPAVSSTVARRRADGFSFGEDRDAPLRVVDGPDVDRVTDDSFWDRFVFRVRPESDRMGVRLSSPPLPVVADASRLSGPVAPGTIQVAGGQAIVLGVACGTMGGYPAVGHVIACDIGRLGQLRAGDAVRFRRVTLSEARGLDREAAAARFAVWRRLSAIAAEPRTELA